MRDRRKEDRPNDATDEEMVPFEAIEAWKFLPMWIISGRLGRLVVAIERRWNDGPRRLVAEDALLGPGINSL